MGKRGPKNSFEFNTNTKNIEDVFKDTNTLNNQALNEAGSEEFKLEGLPKTTCSACQENKVRMRKKTPKKSSRIYYEDELGRPWNGKKCADCVRKKAREHMRSKRSAPKIGDV